MMTPPATTGPVVVALTPDDDRAVLATAAAAAAAGDERLVICSVVDSDREREAVRAALAEQLAEAQLSTPPTLTVRVGDRTAEVLACAADHHAAMVVTGPATARDGVVARWLHPTLPSTLVRAAPAALLVVRAAGASGGIVAATDLSTREQAVLRAAADAQARGGGDVTALRAARGGRRARHPPRAHRSPPHDGSAIARVWEDANEKDRLKIQGSPTFVFDGGRTMLYGNFSFGVLHATCEELVRGLFPCGSAC